MQYDIEHSILGSILLDLGKVQETVPVHDIQVMTDTLKYVRPYLDLLEKLREEKQNFASELEEKDKKINKMKRILYCLVVAFQEGQLKLVTSKTAANERLALNVKIMEATQILKEDQEMGSA